MKEKELLEWMKLVKGNIEAIVRLLETITTILLESKEE